MLRLLYPIQILPFWGCLMTLGYSFIPYSQQFPGGVTSLPNPPWKLVPCLSLPNKCKLLSRALLPLSQLLSETLMALGPSTPSTSIFWQDS